MPIILKMFVENPTQFMAFRRMLRSLVRIHFILSTTLSATRTRKILILSTTQTFLELLLPIECHYGVDGFDSSVTIPLQRSFQWPNGSASLKLRMQKKYEAATRIICKIVRNSSNLSESKKEPKKRGRQMAYRRKHRQRTIKKPESSQAECTLSPYKWQCQQLLLSYW